MLASGLRMPQGSSGHLRGFHGPSAVSRGQEAAGTSAGFTRIQEGKASDDSSLQANQARIRTRFVLLHFRLPGLHSNIEKVPLEAGQLWFGGTDVKLQIRLAV